METKKTTKRSISVFDKIRRYDKAGNEFWSAKQFAGLLGYTDFKLFVKVIEKAETACRNAWQSHELHFKQSEAQKNRKKEAPENNDVNLSRYACYLIIQNADPVLKPVAVAQSYMAAQTRFAEVDRMQKSNTLKILKKRRFFLRNELAKENLKLAGLARKAGIVKPQDYALFQNHGYRGLYGGLDAKAIREISELGPNENILDHMDSTELAVNLFRVKQTAELLNKGDTKNSIDANSTHFAVGLKTRHAIEQMGEALPENLPVLENIKSTRGKGLASRKSKED
ncbi:DNA damage-inducible protein D [Flavobacterium sp. HBTb2-11-1]|uniref:DNA damage-inducible protein D n=1 Tax=Flavobacterium sp. HBTb2-11-1 TaxID=2692212 RepID=UPI00136A37E3|nr:DNA damage-inducible protein D [Flavobacterium sp. HBTb2-11-1]MXO06704.1 DNA damage-inducible protein D [Flavobacterium sp. HBTb2-11-1]